MKNSKLKDRLTDALLELCVCVFCIVLGIFILKIFNVDVVAGAFSLEFALIIGCVTIITLIVLCYTLFCRYKRKK